MSVQEDAIKKKDFLQCVDEARKISASEQKDYTRISKKKIMKNRLVQLYSSGVYSNREIASILGVNVQTVYRLLKKPDIIEELNKYANEEKQVIDAKLRSLRDRSVDTLSDLLDSDDDSVRLQTAKAVLDKTGHGDKREIEQNVNITYEERLNNILENVSFDVQDLEYIPNGEEE